MGGLKWNTKKLNWNHLEEQEYFKILIKNIPILYNYITEKLNNKDLDYQDIEEFMLTKKELEDLQEAIGKILT